MSRWKNSCQNVVLAFPWEHMNKCLLTPGRTQTADQSSKSSLMNQCSKLGSLRWTHNTKAKCPTSSLQQSLTVRKGSCGPGKVFSLPWENARSLSSEHRLLLWLQEPGHTMPRGKGYTVQENPREKTYFGTVSGCSEESSAHHHSTGSRVKAIPGHEPQHAEVLSVVIFCFQVDLLPGRPAS